MPVVLVDSAKKHLRIDDNIEDEYIGDLVMAAEGAIEDMLGRPLLGEGGWADEASIPANVVHAIKLAIGELYANREADIRGFATIGILLERHSRVSFG